MAYPLYDANAVKAFVSNLLQNAPRGAKAELARRADVKAPTLTKWTKGETCPSPDYWPAIEEQFNLPKGTIIAEGGVEPTPPAGDPLIIASARSMRHAIEAMVRQGMGPGHPEVQVLRRRALDLSHLVEASPAHPDLTEANQVLRSIVDDYAVDDDDAAFEQYRAQLEKEYALAARSGAEPDPEFDPLEGSTGHHPGGADPEQE